VEHLILLTFSYRSEPAGEIYGGVCGYVEEDVGKSYGRNELI